MMTAEEVDEGQAGAELFGFNEEAGAIGDPGDFHAVLSSQFSALRG